MDDARTTRRLIVNPVSGSADHVDEVRLLAAAHRFPVVETEHSGHATDLAMEAAADGVDLLAVCGGDGTIHEVVDGLAATGSLDSVTLCVVPAGTENIIAGALGIEDLADGFDLAERGETRRLDLGIVNDEPFCMAAVAGLPADGSDATTSELKRRFGSFAFVIASISEGLTFDGLQVEIDTDVEGEDTAWAGDGLAVLVGNLRDVSTVGGQANAEDGLLEIEVIEQMPPGEMLREAVEQQLLDREPERIRQYKTTTLELTPLGEEPIRFSLDGEIRTFERAQFEIDPRRLRIRVGPAYTSHPKSDS